MKNLISVLVIASMFSCGQSRNQLKSNLINEKKLLKDSWSYAKGMENYFRGQAKKSIKSTGDSLQGKQWSDSSAVYFIKGQLLEEKIKAATFSIDSLSKLK